MKSFWIMIGFLVMYVCGLGTGSRIQSKSSEMIEAKRNAEYQKILRDYKYAMGVVDALKITVNSCGKIPMPDSLDLRKDLK